MVCNWFPFGSTMGHNGVAGQKGVKVAQASAITVWNSPPPHIAVLHLSGNDLGFMQRKALILQV